MQEAFQTTMDFVNCIILTSISIVGFRFWGFFVSLRETINQIIRARFLFHSVLLELQQTREEFQNKLNEMERRIDACQELIYDRNFRSTEQILLFQERFVTQLPEACDQFVNKYVESVRIDHLIHLNFMWSYEDDTPYWDWQICIVVEGQATDYFIHRYILGTKSKYFHLAFSERWTRDSKSIIGVSQKISEVFPLFLDYLYIGEVEIDVESTIPLLWLSDYLGVRSLLEKVLERIKKVSKPTTWSTLAEEANKLGIYELLKSHHRKFKRTQRRVAD